MTEMIKTGFSTIQKSWAVFLKWYNTVALTLFTIGVWLAILIGWRLSRCELMTPKHGTGYLLGPLGTLMVIVLMFYPLRKRMRAWTATGSIKRWFQIHMFLGIVGPILILFHANFHLGALNSNLALFSILIVSSSGVVGKYSYARIHRTLYGERTSLIELQKGLKDQEAVSEAQFALIPGINDELQGFADKVVTPTKELILSIRRLVMVRWGAHLVRSKVRRRIAAHIDEHAAKHQWSRQRRHEMRAQMYRKTDRFLQQVLKVTEFNFCERLFSYWHMLHVPLVFTLAAAVLFHVLAVNRY